MYTKVKMIKKYLTSYPFPKAWKINIFSNLVLNFVFFMFNAVIRNRNPFNLDFTMVLSLRYNGLTGLGKGIGSFILKIELYKIEIK
jgi:hypothetical protein